jgi:aspartyl/asparaginyl beta-hydroxylase
MQSSIKFPFCFDRERLKMDAGRIRPHEWTPHFNTGVYEGEWDGIALRSVGGRVDKLYPDLTAKGVVADTEIIARCAYFQEVLGSFQCALRAARILRLRPGAKIREHRDYNMGYEDGEVRIHIPIQTNPGVLFFLDGHVVDMEEGEVWYLDVSLPHAVENRGTTDRLHLVLDCAVNEWLDGFLCGETSVPIPATVETRTLACDELERFRELVLQKDGLQEQLREVTDRDAFVSRVLSLGKEHGCEFTAGDIRVAMQAGMQGWIERWVH